MTQTVELPLWAFVLILLFAAVTFASHFLFPSVRWFFRRRLERAVARLNQRLERPIEPFKLARRYDMIQRLIYDPQVAQAVSDHAAAKGIPENVAFEEARRYAREIVPSFSAFTYFSFAIRAARLLSNAIYRVRLGSYDEGLLKAIDRDATVVFVMNHRSNMDYVLVTYLVAKRSALSYAVGEWARVWPLSRLIRAMGAYFIRRKSQNALYRAVLAAYVRLATRAGVTQAMFPEGGLSLTGAMAPPKHGLLKYIVDGSAEVGKDVVFVPVALNYDRVLEDKILIRAAQTGDRRFRARIGAVMLRLLRQFWLWVTGRYQHAGQAAVSFGRPLSVSELPQTSREDRARMLSTELMRRIGEVVPVLPVPMVSYLLLQRGAMSEAALLQALRDTVARMPLASIHLPEHAHDAAIQSAILQMRRRKLIRTSGGVVTPDRSQIDMLRYYANSIAHLVPAALEPPSETEVISATAKENSASAGS
ncbi:Acyltransferase family protein associated with ethylmalonyl-CoA pathway [Tritonibacter mobilis]|uniref:1-acyl-sn-glycerol-3-phosphate acyltransferase n=1 Tax=Tritonibacter mobilis TaxID=379347 RepID=UPI0001B8A43E|nr:1-acyl-sn-glycerol-3-phosphate acyltransferase [Tritonibacter mobilis]EEW60756.1 glycerol-3-phosphate acyltransferase [Ruegeria sp. TrichCH4B]MBW3244330.1 1-acyl-sn-glycerol-3-phosphate acyltransferase [Epibacterium sp. DP7N7-1]MCA2006822.1 1-acyl-sn-glycerol-3-phosphate acyltransferase [Tritonibacter mobilis]SDX54485.1 glycerol-3-phosphate acyltransferase [Tritonibacter mobilis]VCU61701.1 Acyltransferase family protein associated with ethylmalonyl-CoA pathway [Tritonibacter mobilis]